MRTSLAKRIVTAGEAQTPPRSTRTVVPSGARAVCLASLLILAAAGCERSGDGEGEGEPLVAEGSAAAPGGPSAATEDSAAGTTASGVADDGEAAPGGAEPERDRERPPTVDLDALLAPHGFERATEIAVDEFVQLPPGASADAARFRGADGSELRVAHVTYASERFAAPHVSDVRERIRLLPSAGEAVVARGATVIHIRALDQERADRAARILRESLGWAPPAEAGSGERSD